MLPLTAFEEYMLTDNHPAYPMSCFLNIRFRGRFDVDRFNDALKKVLVFHPLLSSCVETATNGKIVWKLCDPPMLQRQALGNGIDLFHEPSMKIMLDEQADNISNLCFETHHTACDAAGTQCFLEDLLLCYEQGKPSPFVNPGFLSRRGNYGVTVGNFLYNLPKHFWGLERARTFLFNRILPLVPEKPDLTRQKPPAAFPAVLRKEFDEEQTKHVLNLAKENNATLNDWLINAVFFAMKDWQQEERIDQSAGRLRIAVPINLRTKDDELMPAANIVSMVFLDRKTKQLGERMNALQSIRREMQHIKRCQLGLALIFGLSIYRKLFGSYRKMIDQSRCWTTATVSNLGILFGATRLRKKNGHVVLCGGSEERGLELLAIDTVPPIRPQTALGICVFSYAKRLTVNMQYDTTLLTEKQAQNILERIR